MIRTQIQFTTEQLNRLRQLSATTGRSIADLTRDAVEDYIARMGGPDRQRQIQQARIIAGKFASGKQDVSVNHDEYLVGAFEE
jgi:hypothetical protein